MDYQTHYEKWSGCHACRLCEDRQEVCLYRGAALPVDCLFIGEAPGPQEDQVGEPFIGPSGRLLDEMIGSVGFGLTWGVTNVVGCFPNRMGKIRRPTKEEVSTCWPRLEEMIRIADPWAIVFVGKVASQEVKPIISGMFGMNLYEMIHPAALLRRGRKGVDYLKAFKTLERINEDFQSYGY